MKLVYNAVSASGAAVSDVMEAGSVDEAMDVLRGKGLFVTQIEPEEEREVELIAGVHRETLTFPR